MNATARSNIIYTTEVRGLVSGTRSPREEAEQREAMKVVLAQPHRRGSDDERLGTALGRFCEGHKPYALGNHLFAAGECYGRLVYEYKNAMGFLVPGWAPSENGYADLTEEQQQARKELAIQRKADADMIVIPISIRLPFLLEMLTCDDRDLPEVQTAVLVKGLTALAAGWRLGPRSFRDEG
jgi:hypothetical protein